MNSSSSTNPDAFGLFYKFAGDHIERQKLHLEEDNKCKSCFMTQCLCICSRVKDIYQKSETKPKSNLKVFMHYKEWGRASNTGKLLSIGMPEKSSISIFGSITDEEEMLASFVNKPVLILYPSPDSKPISEYNSWFSHQSGVTLCVLDSTWSQSSAMNNRLPEHIPRVRIDDEVLSPSLFLNRKQSTNKTKVCTVEAVALALRAMGEDESALNPIFESLRLSVDAVLQQSGKKAVYNNNMASMSTHATIVRPKECPSCNANCADTVFKNLGTHKRRPSERSLTGSDNDSDTESSHPFVYRTWKCTACSEYFEVDADGKNARVITPKTSEV
jgi:DTW domain-containing protein YfiP